MSHLLQAVSSHLHRRRARRAAAAEPGAPVGDLSGSSSDSEDGMHDADNGTNVSGTRESSAASNANTSSTDDGGAVDAGVAGMAQSWSLRKRMTARRHLKRLAELEKTSASPSAGFGYVQLEVVEAVLPSKVLKATNAAVGIELDSNVEQTTLVPNSSHPVWNAAFVLSVSDITCDLRLTVLNIHSLKDHVMGACIVPLTSLMDTRGPLPQQDLWLELFPQVDDLYTYAEPGLPSGMDRPKSPLGFLHIRVTVIVNRDLLLLYALAPVSAPTEEAEGEEGRPTTTVTDLTAYPDPKEIKRNNRRIKRALAIHWVSLILALLQWERPFNTLVALALYIWLCLYLPPFLIPLVCTCFFLGVGYQARSLQENRDIPVWTDEAAKGRGPLEKVRHAWEVINSMQAKTAALATLLEKSNAALNWADPRVSLIVAVVSLAASTLLSLLLLIFNVRHLLALLGLCVLGITLASSTKKAAAAAAVAGAAVAGASSSSSSSSAVASSGSRSGGGAIGSPPPSSPPSTPLSSLSTPFAAASASPPQQQSSSGRDGGEGEGQTKVRLSRSSFVKNFVRRIPSDPEVIHRRIAAMAVVPPAQAQTLATLQSV